MENKKKINKNVDKKVNKKVDKEFENFKRYKTLLNEQKSLELTRAKIGDRLGKLDLELEKVIEKLPEKQRKGRGYGDPLVELFE